MKRAILEAKLRALGWTPSRASGTRHTVWIHPVHPAELFVPNYDLIWDSNAAAILAEADGGR